jgi:hypothetical protein
VTEQCHDSLLPALQIAGRSRPLVEKFIKDEKGHDRILALAMQSFAENPNQIPASDQTKVLMFLLRFAARKNFLAFAMAINFFERSSYEKIDPMAKLLLKGGFEKAARQINRHMEINDAGEHENIACGFLQSMAPCDTDFALEAMRIAEAISLVMNTVPQSALALYDTLRNHSIAV